MALRSASCSIRSMEPWLHSLAESVRYTARARVEATMGRWKQVIGDGLRAHTDERRATELKVAVYALNRMLELGRPEYVRVA